MGWSDALVVAVLGSSLVWLLATLNWRLKKICAALDLQATSPRPMREAFDIADQIRVIRIAMAGGFGALTLTGEKSNEKLEAIADELRKMQGH